MNFFEDWQRAALHFPVGIIAALLSLIHWSLCLGFVVIFLAYEISEDWRIEDRGYKDIFGFACGFATGSVIAWIYKLLA